MAIQEGIKGLGQILLLSMLKKNAAGFSGQVVEPVVLFYKQNSWNFSHFAITNTNMNEI